MAFQKSQADMWAFRSRGQGRRKRPHRGDFRPAQPHSGRRPGVSASESPMALYGLPRAGRFSGARSSHRLNGITPCRSGRSEEHTSELQSLMRISYAVFCLTKQNTQIIYIKLTTV